MLDYSSCQTTYNDAKLYWLTVDVFAGSGEDVFEGLTVVLRVVESGLEADIDDALEVEPASLDENIVCAVDDFKVESAFNTQLLVTLCGCWQSNIQNWQLSPCKSSPVPSCWKALCDEQ